MKSIIRTVKRNIHQTVPCHIGYTKCTAAASVSLGSGHDFDYANYVPNLLSRGRARGNEFSLRLSNCFLSVLRVRKADTRHSQNKRNKEMPIYHNEDHRLHFPQPDMSVGKSLPL